MLEVNTMNFCSFSHCPLSPSETLVAVPNTLASEAVSGVPVFLSKQRARSRLLITDLD